MKPSLIVHGGAGNWPDETIQERHAGIQRALASGWGVLSKGGPAIDAVEAAIVALEEDPVFDAGVGSHLNRDGRVQLDAILMDGQTLKSGAIAAVERIRNPIRLARKILEETQHMMFVGAGAEQFAVEHGMELCAPEDLIIERERIAWQRCRETKHDPRHHLAYQTGTVGAVAIDSQGRLFAGTSTGGTCCKLPGRVGDSPLIGCGCYADAEAGGVSCTGYGEGIMKIVMAKMAVDLLRGNSSASNHRLDGVAEQSATTPAHPANGEKQRDSRAAQSVADRCVSVLASRAYANGGLILLDRAGNPAAAFNTRAMSYGYVTGEGSFFIHP